jgi:hypothetical protein
MIDAQLIFDGTLPATGQAITVTAPSTNVLDFGANADRGAGMGRNMDFHVQVLENFAAAGAATLQIAAQVSTDNATWKDLILSPVMAKADLVLGAKLFRYPVPFDGLNDTALTGWRYLRLNYTVATGPFTAGKVISYLTAGGDRNSHVAYPIGYNTSNI